MLQEEQINYQPMTRTLHFPLANSGRKGGRAKESLLRET